MKTKLLAAFAAASVLALAGCSGGDEVGDVSLGLFTLKDIKINTFQDPKVPGVTCHVASIEANLSLADPSDSSVSCRQTGEITPEMIASIDRSKSGEVVFTKSKSILLKTMKIRRIYDAETQTLLYISYSTKQLQAQPLDDPALGNRRLGKPPAGSREDDVIFWKRERPAGHEDLQGVFTFERHPVKRAPNRGPISFRRPPSGGPEGPPSGAEPAS